jgi:hypothetical protein
MGITLFTFGGLFGPLQAFIAWLAPSPRRVDRAPAAVRAAPAMGQAHMTRPIATRSVPPRNAMPLRIVRVVESSSAPASAGRMFMSGRMADVCAELDRLAALEAAAG